MVYRVIVAISASFAEDLDAEPVDRRAFDERRFGPELVEAVRDFFGGLVGEGEGVDARRVDSLMFDQEPDPLYEAVRLPCSGTREYERRTKRRFDRRAL